jgi:catalase
LGTSSRHQNLTQAQAEEVQGKNFNHATQDLFDAIARGEFPQWELCVQIMSDDEHQNSTSIRWMIRRFGQPTSSRSCP